MTPFNKSVQCVTQRNHKHIESIKASLLSKDMIKKRNESLITSSQHFVALQKPEKKNIYVTKTFTTILNFIVFKGHNPCYFRLLGDSSCCSSNGKELKTTKEEREQEIIQEQISAITTET